MSRLDPIPYHIGHAAETSAMRARLARVLVAHWDPAGALAQALAARPVGADPTRPRTVDDVARDVAGILAAGGTAADVSGYLRREEDAVLGPPTDEDERTARGGRRARVREALWRTVRGIERPGDIPEPSD